MAVPVQVLSMRPSTLTHRSTCIQIPLKAVIVYSVYRAKEEARAPIRSSHSMLTHRSLLSDRRIRAISSLHAFVKEKRAGLC